MPPSPSCRWISKRGRAVWMNIVASAWRSTRGSTVVRPVVMLDDGAVDITAESRASGAIVASKAPELSTSVA